MVGEWHALKVSWDPVRRDSSRDMHQHFCEVNALRRLAAMPGTGIHATPALYGEGLVSVCRHPTNPLPQRLSWQRASAGQQRLWRAQLVHHADAGRQPGGHEQRHSTPVPPPVPAGGEQAALPVHAVDAAAAPAAAPPVCRSPWVWSTHCAACMRQALLTGTSSQVPRLVCCVWLLAARQHT